MLKRFLKLLTSVFIFLFILSIFNIHSTKAASDPIIEIGQVRSLGDEAVVPVYLKDIRYLTSGHVIISVPNDTRGVTVKRFKAVDLFDDDLFRTISTVDDKTLTIDFQSQTGLEERITEDVVIVGYITYELSDDLLPGQTTPLEVTNLVATEKDGEDLLLQPLNGKIERKMPFGDVVGHNKVTAAGAMRILQHIKGDTITDREQFLSADVDGDGLLTQNDAQQILDYVAGKRMNFLAVQAKELMVGVVDSPYYETVNGLHGREPYVFDSSGSMPSGINLNEETGELTGEPRRAGEYEFAIEVTDASGNIAERKFIIKVIESNIESVEKIPQINVKRGEVPNLPTTVRVTYKDDTTGTESVTWESVDTSVIGAATAKGLVGDTGYTIIVPINVVDQNYLSNIQIGYFELLNVYTIVIDVSKDVYVVTVDGMLTHYEGNDQFSLASSRFNSSVTLKLYDKYGNLLETRVQKLN